MCAYKKQTTNSRRSKDAKTKNCGPNVMYISTTENVLKIISYIISLYHCKLIKLIKIVTMVSMVTVSINRKQFIRN